MRRPEFDEDLISPALQAAIDETREAIRAAFRRARLPLPRDQRGRFVRRSALSAAEAKEG